MDEITTFVALLRITIAGICGAAMGWERGRHHHPAGFRTHILISMGTATFLVVALRWKPSAGLEALGHLDPLRVLQGIVSGIGLLAAGSIIREGSSVRGVTTAASIWAVTAVGTACGFGQFDIAIAVTSMSLIVTSFLHPLDPKEHDEPHKTI